jgi:hypothetical protein
VAARNGFRNALSATAMLALDQAPEVNDAGWGAVRTLVACTNEL